MIQGDLGELTRPSVDLEVAILRAKATAFTQMRVGFGRLKKAVELLDKHGGEAVAMDYGRGEWVVKIRWKRVDASPIPV